MDLGRNESVKNAGGWKKFRIVSSANFGASVLIHSVAPTSYSLFILFCLFTCLCKQLLSHLSVSFSAKPVLHSP